MKNLALHGRQPVIPADQQANCGHFGYLFPDGDIPAYDPASTPDNLKKLQEDLYTHADPGDVNNSPMAPVFTYLGQFIDHDITNQGLTSAAAKDVVEIIELPTDDFAPQPRDKVTDAIMNDRTGRLDLDSLYGPKDPTGAPAHDKLISLMRFHGDRAKMWIGLPTPLGGIPDRLPEDGAADLLRLGRLMDPENGNHFTAEDFAALPETIRKPLSVNGDGVTPNMRAAVIGDARNDENLFVAQLHLAFLRFHNRMVDALRDIGAADTEDELFDLARDQVTLHYQWLVMNVYLPTVCDPVALQEVKASGAKMYGDFRETCGHEENEAFPMPIEFAVAAFRFGHSMVRGTYDWNSAFGRNADTVTNRAKFEQLFEFTGAGGLAGAPTLPENWVIDWRRTAMPNSEFADRSTRRLDTNLAVPLREMINEGEGRDEKNLAARNLKRGVRMSVPSAQACIATLNDNYGLGIRPLTKDELTFGRTGQELEDLTYDTATPLWFYTLKEAEMRHAGQHLGALGTHIVAGTIAGLIIHDPSSYWNRDGSHEGRWHPVDGVRASGVLVDSLPAMLRAALLLDA